MKERLSNPLIFSFLISWLVYNWKIPVALIWFDENQISATGCKSIFEFIEYEWSKNGKIKEPIFVAFGYTLLLPVIKNLNRLLNSFVYKYADILDFKILKKSSVSIEKHLKIRDAYFLRTQELDKIFKDEDIYIAENNQIRNELSIAKENQKNADILRVELNDIINGINDISFLNGFWNVTYVYNQNDRNKKQTVIEKVEIISGRYQIVSENKVDHMYDIRNFYLNKRNKTLFFVKYLTNEYARKIDEELDNDDYMKICELRFVNEDKLSGDENRYVSVVFERISMKTIENKIIN
nr:hypothetical protein [uncultured Flavobacterium sp.]